MKPAPNQEDTRRQIKDNDALAYITYLSDPNGDLAELAVGDDYRQYKDQIVSNELLKVVDREFDDTVRGLTDAGTAVVAVAAVVATVASAGALAPVTAAAVAGGTATFAAGGAFVVATAAASSFATTAAVSATNAGMNAEGDGWKKLKSTSKTAWDDTTSRESFKNAAIAAGVAAVTFGVTQGIDHLANGSQATTATGSTGGAGDVTKIANTNPSVTSLSVGGAPVPDFASAGNFASGAFATPGVGSKFLTALKEASIQTVASSAAQSVVNGESFLDALESGLATAVVMAAGSTAMGEVASAAADGKISNTTHLVANSAIGCGMAVASGGNCASGVIGAGIGALIGDGIHDNRVAGIDGDLGKAGSQNLAKIAGAMASAAVLGPDDGDSVFAGANISQSAQNIYNEVGVNFTAKEQAEVEKAIKAGRFEDIIDIVEDKVGDVDFVTEEKIRKLVYKEVGGNEFLASLDVDERGLLVQGESIGVFFDGTNNNGYRDQAYNDNGEIQDRSTNIWKMTKLYNGKYIYQTGVGSSKKENFIDTTCQATGCGANSRTQIAMDKFSFEYSEMLKDSNQPFVIFDTAGFSRGGPTATNFANIVIKDGITSHNGNIEPELLLHRAQFLYDRVASFGLPGNDIDIGKDFTTKPDTYIFHITAEDERRSNFDLQSIKNKDGSLPSSNWIETTIPGVHSDIGGGYYQGEQNKSNDIALYSLNKMIEMANKKLSTTNNNQNIFNDTTQDQKPSQNATDLIEFYLESKNSGNQSNIDAAKKLLQQKYIHNSIKIYHPAHWSFGKRDIFYPNNNIETKPINLN